MTQKRFFNIGCGLFDRNKPDGQTLLNDFSTPADACCAAMLMNLEEGKYQVLISILKGNKQCS